MQIMTIRFDSPVLQVAFCFHLIRQTVINEINQLPRTQRGLLQIQSAGWFTQHNTEWLDTTSKWWHRLFLCVFFLAHLGTWNSKHQSHSRHISWSFLYLYLFLRIFPLFAHCSHKVYISNAHRLSSQIEQCEWLQNEYQKNDQGYEIWLI